PSTNEGNAGTTAFTFNVNLSYAYGQAIQVNYQTSDGSATVADTDYQAKTASVSIPAGSTTASFTVNVNGDTKCESNETFNVTLTSTLTAGNTNAIPLGATTVASATIVNDDGAAVVTVSSPPSTQELSAISVTPSSSLCGTATGPVTWSISPALPSGASFSTSTGAVNWTPSCGQAGSYGPFTLTATPATG